MVSDYSCKSGTLVQSAFHLWCLIIPVILEQYLRSLRATCGIWSFLQEHLCNLLFPIFFIWCLFNPSPKFPVRFVFVLMTLFGFIVHFSDSQILLKLLNPQALDSFTSWLSFLVQANLKKYVCSLKLLWATAFFKMMCRLFKFLTSGLFNGIFCQPKCETSALFCFLPFSCVQMTPAKWPLRCHPLPAKT